MLRREFNLGNLADLVSLTRISPAGLLERAI
jgi:hypothetical protein